MPFLPTTFSTSQPRAVFFALLFALLLTCAANAAESVKVLVQSSPLAGSQYYALSSVWPEIRAGDKLLLTREPDNRHDANAIRVEWNGQRLGYVPRSENRALAAAMDRGDTVEARVSKLRQTKNPWQRIEFEVYLVL